MKVLLIVLLLLTTDALAFDSNAWLARRAWFRKDAEDMRAVYSNVVARATEPAENVRVPIEVHPDGSVKTTIRAGLAQVFLDENLVWGKDVTVSQCDETGKETLRVEAAQLLFDRMSKRGWVEGRGTVTRGLTVFSGINVYFSTDDEYVLAQKDAALDSKDLKMGGVGR